MKFKHERQFKIFNITPIRSGFRFSISLGKNAGFIQCIYFETKSSKYPVLTASVLDEGDVLNVWDYNLVQSSYTNKEGKTIKEHKIHIFGTAEKSMSALDLEKKQMRDNAKMDDLLKAESKNVFDFNKKEEEDKNTQQSQVSFHDILDEKTKDKKEEKTEDKTPWELDLD